MYAVCDMIAVRKLEKGVIDGTIRNLMSHTCYVTHGVTCLDMLDEGL
jgi:hypothetical protein